MHLKPFALSALRSATTGGRRYHVWMGSLTLIMLAGAYAYSLQLRYGLGVTGMSDHVSWGLYISNFTFLVGMAAAGDSLMRSLTNGQGLAGRLLRDSTLYDRVNKLTTDLDAILGDVRKDPRRYLRGVICVFRCK